MKALKVPLNKAQKVKKILMEKDLFLKGYKYKKSDGFIFYPVKKGLEGFELIEIEFEESKKIPDLKKALRNDLNKIELEKLKTAFDVVGSIAILEVDLELRDKEQIIAKRLLETNHSIKTVLRKDDKHQGDFRTQKMKYLAGVKTKETIHKENGARLLVHVEEVYFSPRLGNERIRISNKIKKGEEVLVLFSGAAPFPIVIAKNSDAKKIVGVEHNKKGHQYGLKNVELNKLENVELYCLDANKFEGKFDRVVMPAPDNAFDFLQKITIWSKRYVHIYTFARPEEFKEIKAKVKKSIPSSKNFKFVKCGSHAPGVFRVCIDFEL
ncbi:MAG: class I SAM-dependent methyltransferase [Candidatus Woesearchaeota archaeon]